MLGKKLEDLPKIRDALKGGTIGWVKASLLASKATKHDEAMWLETALSLKVRELEKRIRVIGLSGRGARRARLAARRS